jgi:hypothetical protein
MILCEWDAPEGNPGQSCVHLFARILSTSFSSVSIFSVCCYSIVSISMFHPIQGDDLGPIFLSCICRDRLKCISIGVSGE